MQRSFRYIAVVTAIVAFPCSLRVVGQSSSPPKSAQTEEGKVLLAILGEIQLLRRDTRRTAVLHTTLAQVQSAQLNVDSLSRALQTTTTRLNQIRDEIQRTEKELSAAEENPPKDPDLQPAYEKSLENIKKSLAALPNDEKQMESRERELAGELQIAQTRYIALSKKLDELLRQLDGP